MIKNLKSDLKKKDDEMVDVYNSKKMFQERSLEMERKVEEVSLVKKNLEELNKELQETAISLKREFDSNKLESEKIQKQLQEKESEFAVRLDSLENSLHADFSKEQEILMKQRQKEREKFFCQQIFSHWKFISKVSQHKSSLSGLLFKQYIQIKELEKNYKEKNIKFQEEIEASVKEKVGQEYELKINNLQKNLHQTHLQ